MIDPKQLTSQKIATELFATKLKRDTAVVQLQSLLAQPGWNLLSRILQIHIDSWGEAILEGGMAKEQEDEIRKDRLNYLLLKRLPDALLADLVRTEEKPQGFDEDDPYEKNTDPTLDK